jgi:hypothetical protein
MGMLAAYMAIPSRMILALKAQTLQQYFVLRRFRLVEYV